MKKLLLGLVALGAANSAMAADMAFKAAPVMPVENWSWQGLYIGAHFGSLWGTKDITMSSAGTDINQSQTQINGYLGGGQIGYNYQIGRWVIGGEFQSSWSNADGTGQCNIVSINNCNVRVDWLGTAAGRVGWMIDHALVFVKAGGAWAHDKYLTNTLGNSLTTATASESRSGGMFGTGVEYAFTPNWSAKIEYDFLDLGTKNITFNNAAAAAIVGSVPIQERIHLIKFGVNYRLGWF